MGRQIPINIGQMLQAIGQNKFQLASINQEFDIVVNAILNALEDEAPEIYNTFTKYYIEATAYHLTIAHEASKNTGDLQFINRMAGELSKMRKKAEEDELVEWFEKGWKQATTDFAEGKKKGVSLRDALKGEPSSES